MSFLSLLLCYPNLYSFFANNLIVLMIIDKPGFINQVDYSQKRI